jgi:transitional endoplasmic reticulum ATPase
MRFTLRAGTDPVATADRVLLHALGLPQGGVVSVGETHCRVRPGAVQGSDLHVGPRALANSGCALGQSVEVRRALPPAASRVVLTTLVRSPHEIVTALHGAVVSAGDTVDIDDGKGSTVEAEVVSVEPGGAGIIGPSTAVADAASVVASPDVSSAAQDAPQTSPGDRTATERTDAALLAGLDAELDVLTGWFSLLASDRRLEQAWSLPSVAGVVLEGPVGCGKSQLVAEAARRAGTPVHVVDTSSIFKPDTLLDRLAAAVNDASGPRVVFVDRIEAAIGSDAISSFRSQSLAIVRWFLDTVAGASQVMCVIGVDRLGDLDASIARSPLLPRVVTVPPPDLRRRELLFEAALSDVPQGDLDPARLAALSSGFSGADILAAILHALAGVAATGRPIDTDGVARAIAETTPSLGSVPLGEATGFGFDRVANLTEVKQRLIEAVVWPMRDPERFARLGIDPPAGLLLYGPPGTGKTFVIKALAHEAGAAFFSVKGAELLDKFVGESERGVRDLFARARAAEPAIIFFDELDALAPVRGNATNSVTDSVVAALLTEIDGVGGQGRLTVIGATNRRDLIDPALLRAGRFETHLFLDLPALESRRALLDISDVPLADDVDLDVLAQRTEGLSFADLTGLLREAALHALRADEDALIVHWHDLEAALARRAATA